MTNFLQNTVECPIGDATLRAMVQAGYAALAVGMVALFENGFQEGEIFSSKQLKACGLGPELVKKIMNQCEGKDASKKKQASKSESNLPELSNEEAAELDDLINFLDSPKDKQVLSMTIQGMTSEERELLPEKIKRQYRWLFASPVIDAKAPEAASVKELFSKVTYKNESEPLDLTGYKGALWVGKGRLFVLSSKDALGELFGVWKCDENQRHFEIYGQKTIKSFCDAFYVEWMKLAEKMAIKNDQENTLSMAELQNVLSEGHSTIRRRHNRVGINAKHNFFAVSVDKLQLAALLIRHRGDLWLELHLPEFTLPSNVKYGEHIKEAKHYDISSDGIEQARGEWVRGGRPGEFYDCLRLCGYKKNSYSFLDRSKAENPTSG